VVVVEDLLEEEALLEVVCEVRGAAAWQEQEAEG